MNEKQMNESFSAFQKMDKASFSQQVKSASQLILLYIQKKQLKHWEKNTCFTF